MQAANDGSLTLFMEEVMPDCYSRTLLFSLGMSVSLAMNAAEQIFRCVEPDGHVSFQSRECGGPGQSIAVDPAAKSGWTSLRPAERQLLKTYRSRDLERNKRRKKSASSQAGKKDTETPVCWKKRKSLEKVAAKLRRGYKASEGEGLRRKRDNYAEYIKKFCS